MKISIVTISFNNIGGLQTTVESVLKQTGLDNIEYIVIDGASSDGTKEYLKTLPDKVKWISEADRGISHAFNKGLEHVTGDMVLFLNSGDYFVDRHVIENVIKDIAAHSPDILSYKVRVTDGVYIPSTDNIKNIWAQCEEPHQGTFVKKCIFEEVGGFSEDYKVRMDYHFFARCMKKAYNFCYIPRIIVKYEPGGISMERKNRMRFWVEGMVVKCLFGINLTVKDLLKLVLYYSKWHISKG